MLHEGLLIFSHVILLKYFCLALYYHLSHSPFQLIPLNCALLIERANEINDNTMPDKNILAILYEEISKDPREALRIKALNCQEQQVPLEKVLTRLLASAGAAPINRTVKIHSMESKTVTLICFRFQVNKFPFGDK